MTSGSVFQELARRVDGQADFLEYDGILQINILGKHSESWTIDLTQLQARVEPGTNEHVDSRVTLSDEVFLALANEEMTLRQAFQNKQVKVEGSGGIGPILQQIFTAR